MVGISEVFLGFLAVILILILAGLVLVSLCWLSRKSLNQQNSPPDKDQHQASALPEAHMPFWHIGDHFVQLLKQKRVSAEINDTVAIKKQQPTGDAIIDISDEPSEDVERLNLIDRSLRRVIHPESDDFEESDIARDEDHPLRH